MKDKNQNKNKINKQTLIIEKKGAFCAFRDKKRDISTKFDVKLFFQNENNNISVEGKNIENVMRCIEYIEKLKENEKIKFYNAARYTKLVKNKLDELKSDQHDLLISLYIPPNGHKNPSLSLFVTSAANNGKMLVEKFLKNFDFSVIKRNFNEKDLNLLTDKLNEIEDQSNIKIMSNNKETLELIGDLKDIQTADSIIQNILSDNKYNTMIICVSHLTINFLKNIKKDVDFNKFFNTTDVEYELIEQHDKIRFQCKTSDSQEVNAKLLKKLEEIGNSLTLKKFQVTPNIYRYLKGTRSLMNEIEERNHVEIIFPEEELKPVMLLENRITKLQLYVCNGNIINSGADVLVNPVNINMESNDGVAKAILDAAGHEYISECKSILKPLNPKEIYVTTAGKICSDNIMHIVCPTYNLYSTIDDLVRFYLGCIYKCIQLRLSTIAFPLLGAGIYNWPVEKTLKAFLKCVGSINVKTCLQKIYLVEYDEEKMKSIVKYCANSASIENLEVVCSTLKIERPKSKVWFWRDNDAQWKQFRSELNYKINSQFQAGVKRFILPIDSKNYAIDLDSMEQTNIETRYSRPISDSQPKVNVAQWFWISKKEEIAYSITTNAEIEDAYLKDRSTIRISLKRHSDDKDSHYILDLKKKTQENENSGNKRKIVRKLRTEDAIVLVEEENENDIETIDDFFIVFRVGGEYGKVNLAIDDLNRHIKSLSVIDTIKDCCLSSIPLNVWKENKFKIISEGLNFQLCKNFVNISQKGAHVVFESQIKSDVVEVKENVFSILLKTKTVSSSIRYPTEWTNILSDSQLRIVTRNTKEWIEIESNFKKTIDKKNIIEIQRIQNKSIWKTFTDEKLYIEGKRSKLNQRQLWHGRNFLIM
jgi:O-acetyl-ADP-ribose deacetylase (regulator of RNase III)